MNNLIKLKEGVASVVADSWTIVKLPESKTEERIQAGKVVLFKLTGEQSVTDEQIAFTAIPASGNIIVPLRVFIARETELKDRIDRGQVGVWLSTHELLEDLIGSQSDLNKLPIIAVYVERFADGRIFSLGTLLRTRYGFKNELRAFGDVLKDQVYFLKRSGYDSFQIRADRSAQDALASLNDFTNPYQGAVDEPRPAFQRYNRGG